LIPYEAIHHIEQSDNYFKFSNRFIFYADTKNLGKRKIDLFLDGKLKEQEKTDYLSRIQSLPENFSKSKIQRKGAINGNACHHAQYRAQSSRFVC